jgi:hypothetical protein
MFERLTTSVIFSLTLILPLFAGQMLDYNLV